MSTKALGHKDFALILCCATVNLATSYSVAVAFPIVPLYAHAKKIGDVTAVRIKCESTHMFYD